MFGTPNGRIASAWLVGAVVLASSATLFALLGAAGAGAVGHGTRSGPATLPSVTFVSSAPPGTKGPDDITHLLLNGRPTIWTAYQNGINPNGSPGNVGGPYRSTIAGYDRSTGALVKMINVTGKLDGLTADPALGRLVCTINEDSNSSMALVDPVTGAVQRFTYSPSPTVGGNGGTDSIAVWGGTLYLAHSNPNDSTQATDYRVSLNMSYHVAYLTPLFFDDSTARNVATGATTTLALTDPDTNFVMPSVGERFAGDLATISQADGKIIFAHHSLRALHLAVLNLTDNVSGNVPPIDGFAVATAGEGTLYVVDAKGNTITALVTDGWPRGTVFVGEPNDNGNPLVGTLNLDTGKITPLGNHFVSVKGLLFVPDRDGASGSSGWCSDPSGGHPHDGARGHEGDGNGPGDKGPCGNGRGEHAGDGTTKD